MKSESTNANKTIKDGQKAGTPPKCIFSYTEQEWPDSADKVKAKKSAKKGQGLFKDDYIIIYYGEMKTPELYCKWVFFLEERLIKDPDDYSKVDWEAFDRTLMQIVAGEAKEVVKATLLQLHPQKVAYTVGTLKLFTNRYIKKELTDMCENRMELNELLQKDNIHNLKINVYLECKHRLANLIYGTEKTVPCDRFPTDFSHHTPSCYRHIFARTSQLDHHDSLRPKHPPHRHPQPHHHDPRNEPRPFHPPPWSHPSCHHHHG